MDQNYTWAQALQKAKMEAKRSKKNVRSLFDNTLELPTSDDTKKTQLHEQFDYYKQKLKESVAQNNQKSIVLIVQRIVQIHAKLTAEYIKAEKEQGEPDTSPKILNHLEKYFFDCSFLFSLISERS